MKLERVETPIGIFLSIQNDLITKQLRKFGAHQRNDLSMLLDFVKVGDTIIDVGAHIGTFAIPLSSKVGPEGRVFAFEADEESFTVLQKNIEINKRGDIIKAENAVVASKEGNYKKIRKTGNIGATKFRLDASQAWHTINTVVLDTWYNGSDSKEKRIEVIKIDAEGMDADVLFGCRKLIEKYKPIIYIEVNNKDLRNFGNTREDIQSILQSFGYHFFRNIGRRHANDNCYIIGKLLDLRIGGNFFDLLAIHPSSRRYPNAWKSERYMKYWHCKESLKIPYNAIHFLYVNLAKRFGSISFLRREDS